MSASFTQTPRSRAQTAGHDGGGGENGEVPKSTGCKGFDTSVGRYRAHLDLLTSSLHSHGHDMGQKRLPSPIECLFSNSSRLLLIQHLINDYSKGLE